MLAVERDASLVLRAHNPLNRCKVQLAKRIVLIAEQTLSSSTVLDRLGPDVHHLAAYERLDRFSSILRAKSQPIHVVGSVIDAKLCKGHRGSSCCRRLFTSAVRGGLRLPHRPTATEPQRRISHHQASLPS